MENLKHKRNSSGVGGQRMHIYDTRCLTTVNSLLENNLFGQCKQQSNLKPWYLWFLLCMYKNTIEFSGVRGYVQ